MTISEKAAYFKGLVDGLGADKDSREGKLWSTLTELLSDIAGELNELNDTADDFADALDEISEDLTYLEEITCDLDVPEDFEDYCPDFGDEECSGFCETCGKCDAEDENDIGCSVVSFEDFLGSEYSAEEEAAQFDENGYFDFRKEEPEEAPAASDEEEDEELRYDGVVYDVTCPNCGEEISFDEETLSKGFIICPNCGEKLEFDLSEE